MKNKKKTVAILGSGVAALAAAIRLAHLGFSVQVFEQQSTYGGKMGEWLSEGYRFDTGPSLFTMPQYVTELLEIDKRSNVSFTYDKLDIVCNYFWQDGSTLTAYADIDKLAAEFENKLNEPQKNIYRALSKSKEKFEITNHVFLEKSLHRLATYLNINTLKSIFRLPKVSIFTTMNNQNEQLFKNEKTIQFFNRYATYNGSNPYQAPATLNVIPHYEFGIGAFAPKKGIRSIADALYEKGVGMGVKFNFNTPILDVNKMSNGFMLNDIHFADIVVCNMDVASAAIGPLRSLLPFKKTNYKPSSSALIFYWGIKRTFDELDTHNIFFTDNYKKEFEAIFNEKQIAEDPTIYINITSKNSEADAPEGCENWFVMVNAPYVEEQNWADMVAQAKINILKKLGKALNCEIEQLIETENQLTPILINDKTSSYKGALYGSSSNNRMAAFLRQPNFSKEHKGLYFCGGSVHPGGGIPLSLLSAKIMTDKISYDYNIH